MDLIKTFLSILSDAKKLDIIDANYQLSRKDANVLTIFSNINILPKKGILIRFLSFFYRWFRSFLKFLFRRWEQIDHPKENGTLVPYFIGNSYLAVLPVVNHLDTANLIQIGSSPELGMNSFRCHAISFLFLGSLIKSFRKATSYQRVTMKYFFDQYWRSYGYYVLCRLYLQKYKQRAVLLSNDHSLPSRTILLAARDEHILTFYMQHAAISKVLPPLIFDYALLEGKASAEQCLKNGATTTQMFICGIPRMDFSLKKQRTRDQIKTIGIAINALDDFLIAEKLGRQLKEKYPNKQFIFRPHPALSPKFDAFKSTYSEMDIVFSNPIQEHVSKFLEKIDLLVSGESNIHLETILLNISSIYFACGGIRRDFYGFLEHKMIPECTSIEAVIKQIDQLDANPTKNIRLHAKEYCGTIGTDYDGRSSELIAETIQSLLDSKKEPIKNSKWAVSNFCDHVYELKI